MQRHRLTAVIATFALALTGCAFSQDTGRDEDTVVIATHDSWAMDEKVIAAFEKESGYDVRIRPQGDAGSLTNKLALTRSAPIADGVFGIDTTFASRAVDAGVLARFSPRLPRGTARFALERGADRLTPVDYGDVCVNVDDTWFAREGLTPPRTLDDLTKPRYRDLFVTPGATTSSPGLAFLLATVAAKGDAWPAYWQRLLRNGAAITSGWSDAYEVDFTASGKGDRPIVVSYASSPPFTVPEGGRRPTTSALLRTCFRQVEYAGVLAGADNPEGARAFVEFMLGRRFQEALPGQMYVFPVRGDATLPTAWARWATVPRRPHTLPEDDIARHRAQWLREWRDLTSR